jgi:hypothetical protein
MRSSISITSKTGTACNKKVEKKRLEHERKKKRKKARNAR